MRSAKRINARRRKRMNQWICGKCGLPCEVIEFEEGVFRSTCCLAKSGRKQEVK